jgi:hypothetical protein
MQIDIFQINLPILRMISFNESAKSSMLSGGMEEAEWQNGIVRLYEIKKT